MAQITTWPIPSGPSGLAMRQQVNLITEALRTSNSGATAPTPTVAGMLWFDTSTTPGVLKQRNSANDDWVAVVPVSGRNLIINGSGRINQVGYSSGTATSTDNEFALDQWFVRLTGQNLTFTGTDAGRTMTAPAGGVSQVIDGANIVGGTYVINWTGTATCTVDGTSRGKGDTFTLTANTNAVVRFTGGTFTDVQIELGTVATAFERMKSGQELLSCQRYYTFGFGVGGALYSPISAAGTNTRRMYVSFPVLMRATPTLTVNVSNITSPSIVANSNIGAQIFGTAGGDIECSVQTSTASAELTS